MSINFHNTKTIVYAEDDLVTLTAYKNRLEQEGFEVKAARDGVEAMRIMSMCVPDLVILDLEMPKFNGGEVLKFIRTNASLKTVPVVILSTNSIVDASQEHFLEHANKRLLKMDCDFAKLFQTIQDLLDGGDTKHTIIPPKPPDDVCSIAMQIVNRFAHA
jgi:chemosensory pili system protein ChpA (sensor histidine kinase/response regulator)